MFSLKLSFLCGSNEYPYSVFEKKIRKIAYIPINAISGVGLHELHGLVSLMEQKDLII